MHKKLLVLLLTIFFAGCQNLHPLPVDEVDIVSRLNKRTDGKTVGLAEANSPKKAIENIKTYSLWYFGKANELREYAYKSDDMSLGFAMAGLVAGVSKSPEGAAAGALLSSVVDMPVDRYQLGVQAANYEKASDTLHCMFRLLSAHRSNPNLPDVQFLNDRIYEVRRKLRKAQSTVTLVTPDLSALQEHMKKIVKRDEDLATAEDDLATKKAAKAAKSVTDVIEKKIGVLEKKQFEEKLGACVAQM